MVSEFHAPVVNPYALDAPTSMRNRPELTLSLQAEARCSGFAGAFA
jgi:hypothetical protein